MLKTKMETAEVVTNARLGGKPSRSHNVVAGVGAWNRSWRLVLLLVLVYCTSSCRGVDDQVSTVRLTNNNSEYLPTHHHHPHPWNNDSSGEIIIHDCDAFYFVYMEYAGKFMHCELANAVPFRMCVKCIADYTIAHSTFHELMKNPHLQDCREKYISADSIQILPTVQRNIETVWDRSDCVGCTYNVSVDPATKEVSFTIPQDILLFMHLFENMTACVNETTNDWSPDEWLLGHGKNRSVCKECLTEYTAVNKQFSTISSRLGGELCMDLIDMMNYTRHNWSLTFQCSHRSGVTSPSIATGVLMALSPAIFYILTRLTKTQQKTKIAKQKRLTSSQDNGFLSDTTQGSMSSQSFSSYSYTPGDLNFNTRLRRVL